MLSKTAMFQDKLINQMAMEQKLRRKEAAELQSRTRKCVR